MNLFSMFCQYTHHQYCQSVELFRIVAFWLFPKGCKSVPSRSFVLLQCCSAACREKPASKNGTSMRIVIITIITTTGDWKVWQKWCFWPHKIGQTALVAYCFTMKQHWWPDFLLRNGLSGLFSPLKKCDVWPVIQSDRVPHADGYKNNSSIDSVI